ncbi:MAG: hypothetical protein GWP08_10530 [Nitrospiraceae bacterium]|nr:hypothetical protein [Nitrospiraceae bacterium]
MNASRTVRLPHYAIVLAALVLTGYAMSAAAATPPIVYVAGDGSGDYNCDGTSDQVQINQALDFVAANGSYTTVYLKGPNTFWIDETILFSANITLEGDSNAVVKLIDNAGWPKYRAMVAQKGYNRSFYVLGDPGTSTGNITIRGFEIDGNRSTQGQPSGQQYGYMIMLQNCYNITINDMHLHDNLADTMIVTEDTFGTDINSQFYNNRVHASGHDGIYLGNVENFQVHDNNFTDNRTDAHIRVQYCNRFKIYNNIGGNDPDRQFSGGIGVSLQARDSTPVNDAEIYGNYFYGKGSYHGIWLWQTHGGAALNTHRDVYIHNNVISWAGRSAIGIEGFHNTIIENNVLENTLVPDNGGTGAGVTFIQGDPGGGVSGFQTIVRNNIIIDNNTYGLDNQAPAAHSFVSDYNNIYNNALGHYNNASSTTDIHVAPELASDLAGIYWNVLSPIWTAAEASGDYSGDMGATEAWLRYHPKSEYGRWDGFQWVTDALTSPCVDAGDPAADYSYEPSPNGGRINLGAFGDTAEASKSNSTNLPVAGILALVVMAFVLLSAGWAFARRKPARR